MKTIIFLGTNKSGSSREAIRAAERMGFYTVVFADRSKQKEQRTEYPDVHLLKLNDLSNIDELRNQIKNLLIKGLEISAIISFTDPYCYLASLLSEEFCNGCFSTEAIGSMQDKIKSRQIMTSLPYSPAFVVLRENFSYSSIPDSMKRKFPLVIKSPKSTGSKDVFKVTSEKQFEQLTRKLSQRYPEEPILIEEYLDGPQYLVEVVVYKKQIHVIAIFKQEISFQKRFIIMGYSLQIGLQAAFYEKLKETVETIVKAHGMEMGTCHLEIRQVSDGWKLIEINPRISGGGMNQLIEHGLGINLVEETIKMTLGQEPDLEPKKWQYVFAQYVTVSQSGILEKVTGKNRALQYPGILEVYIKPRKGAFLTPPLSMGNRYAYVIAQGESEESAKEDAKEAASLITFHMTIDKESNGNYLIQESGRTTEEIPVDNDLTQQEYRQTTEETKTNDDQNFQSFDDMKTTFRALMQRALIMAKYSRNLAINIIENALSQWIMKPFGSDGHR